MFGKKKLKRMGEAAESADLEISLEELKRSAMGETTQEFPEPPKIAEPQPIRQAPPAPEPKVAPAPQPEPEPQREEKQTVQIFEGRIAGKGIYEYRIMTNFSLGEIGEILTYE